MNKDDIPNDEMYKYIQTEEDGIVLKNSLMRYPSHNVPISLTELNSLKDQGRLRALTKFYEKFYTQAIFSGDLVKFGQADVQEAITKDLTTLAEWEGRGTPYGYFVTISPKEADQATVDKLREKIEQKKWITDYVISIEKASQWHVHLYVRAGTKAFSQAKNEIKSSCNKMICNIDFKRIKQGDESKVVNYVIKDGDYHVGGFFMNLDSSMEKLK